MIFLRLKIKVGLSISVEKEGTNHQEGMVGAVMAGESDFSEIGLQHKAGTCFTRRCVGNYGSAQLLLPPKSGE